MSAIYSGKGHSSKKNSKEAAKKAVEEAVGDFKGDAEIVFIFASSEKNQQKVVEGANQATDAEIIGCSTAGEIIGTESYTKNIVALALGGEEVSSFTGLGTGVEGNSEKAGRKAAKAMFSDMEGVKPTVVASESIEWDTYPNILGVAMGSGLLGDNREIMSGVHDVVGPMYIGGGWAGDDWALEETHIYYNDEVLTDSILLTGLDLGVKSGIGVAHGLKDKAAEVEITSTDGNWVKEIDGKPALKVYKDLFGMKAENPQFLLTKPIGLDTQEDELRIREPLDVDKEEGSIMFSESIPEGIKVDIMEATADQVLEGAEKAVDMALEEAGDPEDIAAVLIHDCACRWYFLDQEDSLEEELSIVKEKVGEDVPIVGWYTYGEIASPAPLNGVRHQNTVIQLITNELL